MMPAAAPIVACVGQQADREGTDAHQGHRHHEGVLAADQVAEAAEDERAEGADDEADGEGRPARR